MLYVALLKPKWSLSFMKFKECHVNFIYKCIYLLNTSRLGKGWISQALIVNYQE